MNSLEQLAESSQSVWLDYLERSLITGGGLRDLIERDGLNPSRPLERQHHLAPDRLIIY